MTYRIKRTVNSRLKKLLMIILILLPSIEVVQWLIACSGNSEAEIPFALYNTFLASTCRGHVIQKIYLWFLPLYYIVLINDDLIVDYDTGNKNIIICRKGKNGYLFTNLLYSFLIPLVITAVGLFLNLVLMCIFFRNGTYSPFLEWGEIPVSAKANAYISSSDNKLFQFSFLHPLAANLIFILETSIIAGLISTLSGALSIVMHDRKTAYAISYAFWLIPISMKHSSMLLLQPFSEYGFKYLIPILIWLLVTYIATIIIAVVWEMKIHEI